jgi:hypothetical protein
VCLLCDWQKDQQTNLGNLNRCAVGLLPDYFAHTQDTTAAYYFLGTPTRGKKLVVMKSFIYFIVLLPLHQQKNLKDAYNNKHIPTLAVQSTG